jgi:hypothetical protein
LRTWIKSFHWTKNKLRRFANNIAWFTNARSYHHGFYKWKMIDNDQKKFIPQLAIATKFFHCASILVRLCRSQNFLLTRALLNLLRKGLGHSKPTILPH